jgi:osmotically-inducible protein OsmY
MDDITLRRNVTDALERLPLINAAGIGVATSGGVVTLTGSVRNAAHRMLIEFAVLKIDGVRGLAEVIDVCPEPDFLNTDEEIAKRVVRMIGWNTGVPDDTLQVRVEKGWVTVTGNVISRQQSERVAKVVRQARGVAGVSDLLKVETAPVSLDARRSARPQCQTSETTAAGAAQVLRMPEPSAKATADRETV